MKNIYAKLWEHGQNTSASGVEPPWLNLWLKKLDGTASVIQSLPIVYASEEHRNFIISTWVKSYDPRHADASLRSSLRSNPSLLSPKKAAFKESEAKLAEKLWSKCNVLTDESGYTVHAWVCGLHGLCYHFYCTPELRGIGIEGQLIEYCCGDANVDIGFYKPMENYHCAKPYWNPHMLGKELVDGVS